MILRLPTRLGSLLLVLAFAALLAASPAAATADPAPEPVALPVAVRASRSPALTGRQESAAKKAYEAHPADELVCRPFGECEPCPEDDLKEPFCMPFGNRRLLHCRPAGSHKDTHEVPAWEACGRVVKKEQRNFYEFVTTNFMLLVVCLVIYFVRTSELAKQQYRQLAAKIGIRGGAWQV